MSEEQIGPVPSNYTGKWHNTYYYKGKEWTGHTGLIGYFKKSVDPHTPDREYTARDMKRLWEDKGKLGPLKDFAEAMEADHNLRVQGIIAAFKAGKRGARLKRRRPSPGAGCFGLNWKRYGNKRKSSGGGETKPKKEKKSKKGRD